MIGTKADVRAEAIDTQLAGGWVEHLVWWRRLVQQCLQLRLGVPAWMQIVDLISKQETVRIDLPAFCLIAVAVRREERIWIVAEQDLAMLEDQPSSDCPSRGPISSLEPGIVRDHLDEV